MRALDKLRISTAAAMSALFLAVPAGAQLLDEKMVDFSDVDANSSGGISLDELQDMYPTVGPVIFETYDGDADGRLSSNEFVQFEMDERANRLPPEENGGAAPAD